MKYETLVLKITILLMTQGATTSSTCNSRENIIETTSTNEYLELNRKYIEDAATDVITDNKYPESRVEHDGFIYFSNADGLFVQQKNATTATRINGFPQYTVILLDKKLNLIYFGTNKGLSVTKCGGSDANKITVTDGIAIDFGVVDNIGNVYFGNNGHNDEASEELYVLQKKDQSLIKISGIEQSLGSYTIENICNPNKIAVDTNNNVYVGAYSGYIYLIEPGQTTAFKLKDIKSNGGVTSIVVDSKDNVYFRTNNALYILKNNEKKLTKIIESIDDFNYFLSVDNFDNLYFQATDKTYVLKSEEVNALEINEILNSDGLTTTTFTNLQNFQVKNNFLYFTSTHNGKDIIFSMNQNENTLTEIYRADSTIFSLAIDNSNNIYFVTSSDESQKIVPFILRKNSNTPIEILGVTGHLSHVFSDNKNNIYFGSGNGLHLLQDEEVTPFKLRATESQISSFLVDENDNVYFGTDYDGAFVVKSGEKEATKIDGIDAKYGSYVEVYGDGKYDVIYFKTGGALYKLNGGETSVMVVSEGYSPDLYLSDCMNNTYYVQTNAENSSIISVKYGDSKGTHVTDVEGQVLHIKSDSFSNLYFITDKNQLQVLGPTKRSPIIIAKNHRFSSLNVDADDNVYFTADDVVYLLRPNEKEATKINNIFGKFKSFVMNGDDIFIITGKDNDQVGLFLVRNKLQFDSRFKNRYLGEIDDNSDETIFNILNYLNVKENYLLSKNKNKIVDKTPTSATVLAIRGKFKGRFDVEYIIKGKVDENASNFILKALLEKAIFFDHMSKNLYNFKYKKEIQDISVSIDNLKFSPVEITNNSESISSVEFKNICFNKKKIANTSPLPQTIKVPECNYETKEIILFQVTRGLNKSNENIEESAATVLNSDDENVILNLLNVNENQGVKAKVTLSNDFDLSNLKEHNHEMTLQNFSEDEQDIIVPSKKRVLVNYSVRTFVSETNLNLKQKIRGTLIAKINYTKSEEMIQITIKEAMQVLKKYNLMPSEITLNEDNSIAFNGRAKLIVKRESEPKIIRNFFDV